jgi:hypothetical protein
MAAGDVTQGVRLQPSRSDDSGEWFRPTPGSYWFEQKTGCWSAMPPGAPEHGSGSLSNHDVTEHEDGTITVSPSILIDMAPIWSWHGYLEHGVWREV